MRCQHVDDDTQCRLDATRRVLVGCGDPPDPDQAGFGGTSLGSSQLSPSIPRPPAFDTAADSSGQEPMGPGRSGRRYREERTEAFGWWPPRRHPSIGAPGTGHRRGGGWGGWLERRLSAHDRAAPFRSAIPCRRGQKLRFLS